MIPKNATLRIARPTDNLETVSAMYQRGLGFKLLGSFKNHEGFDGVILGHSQHHYHLEFTCHVGSKAGTAPTRDNLLVFYLPDKAQWRHSCEDMREAGFCEVVSFNPYWDKNGKTFEDCDGYRVVLQNMGWSI